MPRERSGEVIEQVTGMFAATCHRPYMADILSFAASKNSRANALDTCKHRVSTTRLPPGIEQRWSQWNSRGTVEVSAWIVATASARRYIVVRGMWACARRGSNIMPSSAYEIGLRLFGRNLNSHLI